VSVRYLFEIRPTFSTDAQGFSDAWDARVVNKGTQGWYNDPVSGQPQMGYFYDADRNQVTEPVYLDMQGIPLDRSSFKVTRSRYSAVVNPNATAASNAQSGDFTHEKVAANGVPGGFIYLLHFRRFKAQPFSGLL